MASQKNELTTKNTGMVKRTLSFPIVIVSIYFCFFTPLSAPLSAMKNPRFDTFASASTSTVYWISEIWKSKYFRKSIYCLRCRFFSPYFFSDIFQLKYSGQKLPQGAEEIRELACFLKESSQGSEFFHISIFTIGASFRKFFHIFP